jgi:hypothetical protein
MSCPLGDDQVADLATCLRAITNDPSVRICRIKNRLDPAYDPGGTAGYRDVGLNFRVSIYMDHDTIKY